MQVFLKNFQSPQVMYVAIVFNILIAFYKHFFSLIWDFLFFRKPRESLSSMVNISSGLKLESIFKIVLFRMNTFSLTLVFTKVLSQSNILIARLITSVFSICFLVVPDVTKMRWWIMNFQVKFCKNNLKKQPLEVF